MKILLADDERLVRLSIISMLEELYPDQHTYIEVTNGAELLESIQKQFPDLAFVDIKMPLMDGLTAIEKGRILSPNTKWFLLTGYADFSYAQKALHLGAMDYILKPASPEDLKMAMEKAMEVSNAEKKKRITDFSFEIMNAYNMYVNQKSIPDFMEGELSAYIFYTDHWNHNEEERLQHVLEDHIHSTLSNRSSNDQNNMIFYLNSKELCLVTRNEKKNVILNRLQRICTGNQLHTTILHSHAQNLNRLMADIQQILDLAPVRICTCIYQTADLQVLSGSVDLHPSLLPLSQILLALRTAIRNKDEISYRKQYALLEDIFNSIEFSTEYLSNIVLYLQQAMHLTVSDNNRKDILKSLKGSLYTMYHSGQDRNAQSTIEQIQQYVDEHYAEEIGINTIAELFSLTPSYISRIFHQKTGQKFINYLTDVRIANAKRLLSENPRATVKDTAEAVGYISVRHFTKQFVRITGMLPSEYQRQVFSKNDPTTYH